MHKLASFGQKPRSINQSNFYMNIPDSKLFSLIPDLKTPVVSYTYLHQFDSTKGTFQSRFFRIKLGRNKNRVSNFRGKIFAKREIWIDSKNRFPHKTKYIKLSKFSFHCLPRSKNISTLDRANNKFPYLRIALYSSSRRLDCIMHGYSRHFSPQNYSPFGKNYISILTFVPFCRKDPDLGLIHRIDFP